VSKMNKLVKPAGLSLPLALSKELTKLLVAIWSHSQFSNSLTATQTTWVVVEDGWNMLSTTTGPTMRWLSLIILMPTGRAFASLTANLQQVSEIKVTEMFNLDLLPS